MAMTQSNRSSRPARPNKLFTIDAQQLMRVGLLRQAVEVCKRGLVYHPLHVTGYVVLAQAYRELGQIDRAVNVLRDGFRRTGAVQLDRLRAILAGEVNDGVPDQEIVMSLTTADVVPVTAESAPVGDDDRSGAADAHHEPVAIETDGPERTEDMSDDASDRGDDVLSGVHEQTVVAEVAAVDAEPMVVEPAASGDVPASGVVDAVEQPDAVLENRGDDAGSSEDGAVVTSEESGDEMTADAAKASMSVPDDAATVGELHGGERSVSDRIAADEVVAGESGSEAAGVVRESEKLEPVAEPEITVEPQAIAEPEAGAAVPEPDVVSGDGGAAEQEVTARWSAGPGEEENVGQETAALEEREAVEEAAAEIESAAGIDMIAEIEAAAWIAQAAESSSKENISDAEREAETAGGEEPVIASHAAWSGEAAEPASPVEPTASPAATPRAVEGRPGLTLVHDSGEHHHRRSGHAGMLIGSEASLERERTLSLATHAGHNRSRLRSSNLRLIPGLEFAPLRHEDQVRRQPIAPLIHGTMPELTRAVRVSGEHLHHPESIPLPESGLSAASTAGIAIESVARPGAASSPASEAGVPRMSQKSPEQERNGEEHTATKEAQGAPVAAAEIPVEERRSEGLTPLEELARRLEKARIPVVEEPVTRESSARPFEPTIVSETLANILLTQGAYQEALKAFRTLARTRADRMEYFQEKIREIERRIEEQHPG